jgi:hypothetical protein
MKPVSHRHSPEMNRDPGAAMSSLPGFSVLLDLLLTLRLSYSESGSVVTGTSHESSKTMARIILSDAADGCCGVCRTTRTEAYACQCGKFHPGALARHGAAGDRRVVIVTVGAAEPRRLNHPAHTC